MAIVKLAYRLDGPPGRPAVVLASSIGTTWELWDAQVPALAREFRVVRYDHPGHGRSSIADGPVNSRTLACGVIELLDRLGLERAHFCGLSLGGVTGMALALEAPERVDRLVLCCTAARFGSPQGWQERAALVRASGTTAIVERVLERWFTRRYREQNPEVAESFRTMLEAVSREGYAACCEALADWDARGSIGAIVAPTLVLAGADDVATPPPDAELLARSIPGAKLVVLPRAAHLANVEQPGSFAAALLEHLTASSRFEEAA